MYINSSNESHFQQIRASHLDGSQNFQHFTDNAGRHCRAAIGVLIEEDSPITTFKILKLFCKRTINVSA